MLKREEVITTGGCPICGYELETSDNNVIPIETKCNHCKQYYDSYHGMGDSMGRAGDYSWSWDILGDEKAYLAAILKAREGLK